MNWFVQLTLALNYMVRLCRSFHVVFRRIAFFARGCSSASFSEGISFLFFGCFACVLVGQQEGTADTVCLASALGWLTAHQADCN